MKGKNLFAKKLINCSISMLLVIGTMSGGTVAYGAGFDSPDDRFDIERLSNPDAESGEADGLKLGGDRENSYTWAQTELGNYIYLGTNRNLIYTAAQQAYMAIPDWNLLHKIMTDISDGIIPIPQVPEGWSDNGNDADHDGDVDDDDYYSMYRFLSKASLFRYNTSTGAMEQVLNGAHGGYRSAVTFTPKGSDKAYAYFGTFETANRSAVVKLDQDDESGEYENVYESDSSFTSIRSMTVYNETLCIGSLTVGTEGNGDLQILQSEDPAIGNWVEIADINDFAACNPRTDAMAIALSGIWDLITFNDSIYAFIGSGWLEDSENNGFCVYKGTEVGIGSEGANEAGWKWQMIVGPEYEEDGITPTGALFKRGLGEPNNGAASPFLYKAPDGKEYVYVGTLTSIADTIGSSMQFNMTPMHDMMVPAQVYRFDENDSWEMVIGNPSPENPNSPFTEKIGNKYAGFSDTTDKLDSSNLYMWRMAQYDGKLFIGTFDASTLCDIMVMPYKLDLEVYSNDDLIKILFMFKTVLPEEVQDEFEAALNAYYEISAEARAAEEKAEITSEAAIAGRDALNTVSDAADAIDTADFTSEAAVTATAEIAEEALDKTEVFAGLTADAATDYPEETTAAALSAEAVLKVQDSIYYISDDVSPVTASVLMADAYDLLDAAVQEADGVAVCAEYEKNKAIEKEEEVQGRMDNARNGIIIGYKNFRHLLETITVEQYELIVENLNYLAEFCPGLDHGQLIKSREIIELRIMIDSAEMGFDLYMTEDGKTFTKLTDNGFNDPFNYGLRTFMPTSKGLFIGTANPFYGGQLWKLSNAESGGGGGGGSSSGGGRSTAQSQTTPAALIVVLTDIHGHWAEAYITKLVELGIVTGNPDGTFLPDKPVTRAEFAVMTVNAFKLKGTNGKDFSDTINHWSRDYVRIAAENGVITGFDEEHFKPDELITREQMAAMISRALKITAANQTLSFSDSDMVAEWAVPSVASVMEKSIMTLDTQQMFYPKMNATKAMSAAVIYRALGLDENSEN